MSTWSGWNSATATRAATSSSSTSAQADARCSDCGDRARPTAAILTPATSPSRSRCPSCSPAGTRLNALDIPTRNLAGDETTEPSVIGWMPSAQPYVRDPDGHSLEFITLLDDAPDPAFTGPLSAWR